VKSYAPGSKLELERNPNWDKSTDPARTGLPDAIVLDMGLQPDVVNQRLIADAGDDKFAATTGTSVPAALIPTVTGNPAVKARVATSPSGALEYLAMNTKRPALANAAVRKAIEYAVDKQAVQVAEGGPEFGGEIASTLITPGSRATTSTTCTRRRPRVTRTRRSSCSPPPGSATSTWCWPPTTRPAWASRRRSSRA